MKQFHIGIPEETSDFIFQFTFNCPDCNSPIEITESSLSICMESGSFVCPLFKKFVCPSSDCECEFEIKLSDMGLTKTEYEIIQEHEDYGKEINDKIKEANKTNTENSESYVREILHEAGIDEDREKELFEKIYKKKIETSLEKGEN